jgi:hypothetical protein
MFERHVGVPVIFKVLIQFLVGFIPSQTLAVHLRHDAGAMTNAYKMSCTTSCCILLVEEVERLC